MAIFKTLFLIMIVAVTGACLAPHAIGTEELAGTEWRLIEMDGLPVNMSSERPFVLAFGGDGDVSGQACNRMDGEYRLQGQRIFIGPIAATEMSCGEAIDRLEARFLQIVSAPLGYRFALDGTLLLGNPDRPALRLLPQSAEGISRTVAG